ncbi:unnamed protein product, partial [Allacma fusca]
LIISAAAGIGKQYSESDDFLRNINEERLALCDVLPGERSVHLYIFNLTNPADFLNKTNPFPHIGSFEEIGPFSFKETRSRENCRVSMDDLYINFDEVRQLSAESSSNENFDAPLSTANIAFSRFGAFIHEEENNAFLKLEDFVKNGEGYLRQNISPRALLTDGYNISQINTYLREKFPNNLTVLQHDTFTPFMELSTYPRKFTVRSDPETFGQIHSVEEENLDEHYSNGCNVAPATDGSFFPGNITKDTILSFYSEDLCSVVPLVFQEVTTYKSIPALKFVLPENALHIAACDCKYSSGYSNNVKTCFPVGAVDVKTCQQNLPYIASLPHFLNADLIYRQNVSGMSANNALHQSYFIIEPVTGSVLESSLKFQLNVNLVKFEDESLMFTGVAIEDTVFPLFWTEKKFSVAAETVQEILRYLEEISGTTTTTERTSSTAAPTTTRRVDDTTTSPTPISNPAFEALKHQMNDLTWNINKFSVLLTFIGLIFVMSSGASIYFLLALRNKPDNWTRGKRNAIC